MTDIIDEANERALTETESALRKAQEVALAIPVGYPGVCLDCGFHSFRLVWGHCAPCRDEISEKALKGKI